MSNSKLDTAIEEAVRMLTAKVSVPSIDDAYINSFESSARRKAEEILTFLNDGTFPAEQPVFVSIGGGDGEELAYLLERTRASHGILLEFSPRFAEGARRRQLHAGKELIVIEGRAQERIGEAMEHAANLVRVKAGDAIVVTCHAVIHELYNRGTAEFDELGFFGPIFQHPDVATGFTYREPGDVTGWPDELLISADCTPQSLERLASEIRSRHRVLDELRPKPQIIAGESLRLHRTLGLELLAKLFYLEDLSHEIEELSTSVDHAHLSRVIHTAIGQDALREHRLRTLTKSAPTNSFVEKWNLFNVRVSGYSKGNTSPLSIPEFQKRARFWRAPRREEASAGLLVTQDSLALSHQAPPAALWGQLLDASRRNLKLLLEVFGYDSARDIRERETAQSLRGWPIGQPLLPISGASGQGKSWWLYRAALVLSLADGVVIFLNSACDGPKDLAQAADQFWREVAENNDEAGSLSQISKYVRAKDPDVPAQWLTLMVDNVRTTEEADFLVRQPWKSWGVRIAIGCTPEIAHRIECEYRVGVGNFDRQELDALLVARIGPGRDSIPDRVLDLLRLPLLADLYCRLPERSWSPANEFQLYERYWGRLRGPQAKQYDESRFLVLAGDFIAGNSYPWTVEQVRAATNDDDDAAQRLSDCGWLRRNQGGYEVPHDLLLNWAVAEAIYSGLRDGRHVSDSVPMIMSAVRAFGKRCGRDLSYVQQNVRHMLTNRDPQVPSIREALSRLDTIDAAVDETFEFGSWT